MLACLLVSIISGAWDPNIPVTPRPKQKWRPVRLRGAEEPPSGEAVGRELPWSRKNVGQQPSLPNLFTPPPRPLTTAHSLSPPSSPLPPIPPLRMWGSSPRFNEAGLKGPREACRRCSSAIAQTSGPKHGLHKQDPNVEAGQVGRSTNNLQQHSTDSERSG